MGQIKINSKTFRDVSSFSGFESRVRTPEKPIAAVAGSVGESYMSDTATWKTTKQGDVTVLVLAGEFESYGHELFEQFSEAVLDIVQTADPPWLAVDMSETTFFGSPLLGVLFRGWNRLMARPGGRFALCQLSTHAADVFQTTQLDRLWPVFESREEAVEHLATG